MKVKSIVQQRETRIEMPPRSIKPHILIENCGEIMALQDMGLSYCKIAAQIGWLVGAVYEVSQQTGIAVDRPVTGRKWITTQRQDWIITQILANGHRMAP